MSFEVGDKVRVVSKAHGQGLLGNVFTVEEVKKDYFDSNSELDEGNGYLLKGEKRWIWMSDYLELAESKAENNDGKYQELVKIMYSLLSPDDKEDIIFYTSALRPDLKELLERSKKSV